MMSLMRCKSRMFFVQQRRDRADHMKLILELYTIMQTYETQTLRDRILGGAIHGGPAAIYHVVVALRPSLESYLKAPWPDTWTRAAVLSPSRSTQFATAAVSEVVQGDSGNAIYYVVLCASIAAVGGAAMINVRVKRPIPPPIPPPSQDPLPPSPDPSGSGPDDESDDDERWRPDNPEDPPPPPPSPPAVDPDPDPGPRKDLTFLCFLLLIFLFIKQRRGGDNVQVMTESTIGMDIASTSIRVPVHRPKLNPTISVAAVPSLIAASAAPTISHTVFNPPKIGVTLALSPCLDQILCTVFFLVLVKLSARAFRSATGNQDNGHDNTLVEQDANEDPLVKHSTRTLNTLALAESPPTPEHFEAFEGGPVEDDPIADHAEDIALVEADYDPGARPELVYNIYDSDGGYDPHPGGEWYSDSDASGDTERDPTNANVSGYNSPYGSPAPSHATDTGFTDTLPLFDSDVDGPSDTDSLGSSTGASEVEGFADIEDNDDENLRLEDYSPIPAPFLEWDAMETFNLTIYAYLDTMASVNNADSLGPQSLEVAEVEDAFADVEDTSNDELEYDDENENENDNENENENDDEDGNEYEYEYDDFLTESNNESGEDEYDHVYIEWPPFTNSPEQFEAHATVSDANNFESDEDLPTSPETQYSSDADDTSEWDPDEYRIQPEDVLDAMDDFGILHADEVVWYFVPEDIDILAPTVDIIIEDPLPSIPPEEVSTIEVAITGDIDTELIAMPPLGAAVPDILGSLEADEGGGTTTAEPLPVVLLPTALEREVHPQGICLDLSRVWEPAHPPKLHSTFDVPTESLPEIDIGEGCSSKYIQREPTQFDSLPKRDGARPPPPLEQDLADMVPSSSDLERRMHVNYSMWNSDE
ncbi:hypothetical protein BD779DRAFT_1514503 [Infundibulicybe gibba]|nr:hypothetical protein BD779DRAFT_1514503 [Infundibulicybe gibba]